MAATVVCLCACVLLPQPDNFDTYNVYQHDNVLFNKTDCETCKIVKYEPHFFGGGGAGKWR